MKFGDYLKERAVFLFLNLLLYCSTAIFLWLVRVQPFIIILFFICWIGPLFLSYVIDFIKKKKYFDPLIANAEVLDKKYLLPEIMEKPDFMEGRIFYDILQLTDKEMHEHVNKYKNMQMEYREYIEAWVHEIKTPIASAKLILDNQKSPAGKGLYDELNKIEDFVEQALYYARSTSAEKDYMVKEFPLKDCLTKVIKKNAKTFIHKKIKLDLAEIDEVVFSDEKWVEFILNQLIGNSINYMNKDKNILRIFTSQHEHNLALHIVDNGIGIDDKDIGRVFEKGFTGENGRMFRKSTGMGLYLCKKLADKLHLGITIQSQKEIGTELTIIFPKSKVILLES